MPRDIEYFTDILESAKIACDHLKNLTYEEFLEDIKCQDAVIRRLELIGEASNRISQQSQFTYRDLPWLKMKTMRNLLIHEYDEIDFSIVWDTVKNNLPGLIKEIQELIPGMQ